MNLRLATISLLLVLSTACGGSGSGGENTAPDTEAPPRKDSEGPDGTPPTATITFPWPNSATTLGYVDVYGVAKDGSGISAVQVNGQPASLDTRNALEVHWHATIPVPPVGQDVIVSVEDVTGEQNARAAAIQVHYLQDLTPTTFWLLPSTQSIVGFAGKRFLSYDLVSGTHTVLQDFSVVKLPVLSCFNTSTTELYHVMWSSSADRYSFRRMNLSNGGMTEILFTGHLDEAVSRGGQLLCDPDSERLYLLTYVGNNTSEILSITWGDGPKVERVYYGPLIGQAFFENGKIMARAAMSGDILSIDKNEGTTEMVYSGYDRPSETITAAATSDMLYAVSLEGLDEIDLKAGSWSTIVGPGIFSRATTIVADSANNRLLIGDEEQESIISVGLSTGTPSQFLSNAFGDGPKLTSIRSMAVNTARTKAYVLDRPPHTRLVEVNLETRTKTVLANFHADLSYSQIVLDEETGTVYSADSQNIYKTSISTGETTVISSESVVGYIWSNIAGIALDRASNSLFIADDVEEAVFALNLDDYRTTVISTSSSGSGPSLKGLNAIDYQPGTNTVYVGTLEHIDDRLTGAVIAIDVATGNRREIPCATGEFSEGVRSIRYLPETDELLVSAYGLRKVDTFSSQCDELLGYAWFGAAYPMPDGHILTVFDDAITLVSTHTENWGNDSVILAR